MLVHMRGVWKPQKDGKSFFAWPLTLHVRFSLYLKQVKIMLFCVQAQKCIIEQWFLPSTHAVILHAFFFFLSQIQASRLDDTLYHPFKVCTFLLFSLAPCPVVFLPVLQLTSPPDTWGAQLCPQGAAARTFWNLPEAVGAGVGGWPHPLLTESLRPSARTRALRMGSKFSLSPTVLPGSSMQGVFGSSPSQLSPVWWPPATASPLWLKGDGACRLPSWGRPCCLAHKGKDFPAVGSNLGAKAFLCHEANLEGLLMNDAPGREGWWWGVAPGPGRDGALSAVLWGCEGKHLRLSPRAAAWAAAKWGMPALVSRGRRSSIQEHHAKVSPLKNPVEETVWKVVCGPVASGHTIPFFALPCTHNGALHSRSWGSVRGGNALSVCWVVCKAFEVWLCGWVLMPGFGPQKDCRGCFILQILDF